MRRSLKIAVSSVLALALIGGAVFWFEFRSNAKPVAAIVKSAVKVSGPLDGTWTVVADPAGPDATSSWVGYRISEQLAGLSHTDVGRSRVIAGTMTIRNTTVSQVSMTADASKLATDVALRDNSVRTILDTTKYPNATFVSSAPVVLSRVPKPGELIETKVHGVLTLHGVSRSIVAPLQARWDGSRVQVIGEIPIVFADYQIAIPAIAGLVKADDHGTLELQLFLARSP
jgi:polyisoprenoid-binding protein YceI